MPSLNGFGDCMLRRDFVQKLLVVNPTQRMTVSWYLPETLNLRVPMTVSLLIIVRMREE